MNRSGPNRCSGKVLGLIRLPSVPFLGAFSVGIARKRPRPAPSGGAPVALYWTLFAIGVVAAVAGFVLEGRKRPT
jgi:hypothetical protein